MLGGVVLYVSYCTVVCRVVRFCVALCGVVFLLWLCCARCDCVVFVFCVYCDCGVCVLVWCSKCVLCVRGVFVL